MFDNLLSFWKGKDFLTQVLGEFKDMLDETEVMFKSVTDCLLNNKCEPDLKERVYAHDKKVNDLQKDIRRRIVTHLTVQPSVDVNACLLLMSVVKDAERLGDYSKNLYEVIGLLEKPLNRELFDKYFDDIDEKIIGLFGQTKEAFMESNGSVAELTWDDEKKIAKLCDGIIEKLAKSDLSVNEGVCFTLVARHYKRIVAHLVNIATSVIVPLSNLDYFDEGSLDE